MYADKTIRTGQNLRRLKPFALQFEDTLKELDEKEKMLKMLADMVSMIEVQGMFQVVRSIRSGT